MKKILFISACILGLGLPAFSQTSYLTTDAEGNPVYQIPDVVMTAKAPSKRQKRKYEKKIRKFNRLRANVYTVLPYAKEAANNLKEINTALVNVPEDQQKAWLKSKEKDLFGEYEDDIRNMNHSQGVVLIKLIDRECGVSTFSVISDVKNGTTAFFWNGIGRIFGYNLKDEYNPAVDDKDIEFIVRSIESGANPTYWDMITEVHYY